MLVLKESYESDEQLIELFNKIQSVVGVVAIVWLALQIGRLVAVKVAQEELLRRALIPTEWPSCPECGTGLESKGFKPRQLLTLIGEIHWKRRCGRCPNRCAIGQVAPLDQELGIEAGQKTCNSLKRVTSVLAVFVPFEIATKLFNLLTGLKVSPMSIWNWVQEAGKKAISNLQEQQDALAAGEIPEKSALGFENLLLAIGADGVMVPLRPFGGSPFGATVWREVKVGIVAWLRRTVSASGRTLMRPVSRQVAASLGHIDLLGPRLWLATFMMGIRGAERAVWLSDGGVGFWRLFREYFADYAIGVLDFYHAAQNLWKGARTLFDGRTKEAENWFATLRSQLWEGKICEVLSHIQAALSLPDLPSETRQILQNLYTYLSTHEEHIDYARFREMGLPIGSGMVESACKWLIQQRFKGVGMRWSEDGFNNLLHLRLAWVNGQFDDIFMVEIPSPH